MAVVSFGGAYAVLAYVAQQAVRRTAGWPRRNADGLGMAETTPGPLIMVVQFVGFMGAYRNPGALDPMLAGTLGAALTTWVTFVPCFLWIFLGAPYIEALRGKRSLNAALSAITAAIVGVVLNLAVWFALHVVFGAVDEVRFLGVRLFLPVWNTLEPAALILTAAALVAMLRFKLGMFPTLAGAATLAPCITMAPPRACSVVTEPAPYPAGDPSPPPRRRPAWRRAWLPGRRRCRRRARPVPCPLGPPGGGAASARTDGHAACPWLRSVLVLR